MNVSSCERHCDSRVLFCLIFFWIPQRPGDTYGHPASDTSPSETRFTHALDPTSCLPDVCHSCVTHPTTSKRKN